MRDARREVAELARRAGVDDRALQGMQLAVSEAVSNAVLHGYRDGTPGDITILTVAEDHRLEIRVRDRGCGMSANVGGRGAGLGLPLIAELSDTLVVGPSDDGHGTEVHMTFRLPVAVAA